MDEEWYKATFPVSSPLLRTVRVMMRNRHSEGKKRARRAKLYYLLDRDPKFYSVDSTTKEAAERALEKAEERAARLAGKSKREYRAEKAAAEGRAPPPGAAGGKAAAAGKGGKPGGGAAAGAAKKK
jgi:hypothetical protein